MQLFNYPVKYALLGINEQKGWILGCNELDRDYAISGYIVSKVYLVGEIVKYNRDGSSVKGYQVVFPYPELMNMEREYPRYDIRCQCYNAAEVSQIFEQYIEAKKVANDNNNKLRAKCYLSVSTSSSNWKDMIIEKQKKFDERLQIYMEIERKIYDETRDMIITRENKFDKKMKVKKL